MKERKAVWRKIKLKTMLEEIDNKSQDKSVTIIMACFWHAY